MKNIVWLLAFIACLSTVKAQVPGATPGGAGGNRGGGQQMNIGRFYGRIIDKTTNKGIDAASVQLVGNKFDTVTKKRVEAVMGGMLTGRNGDFSLESLPVFGNFKLVITAIGYKTVSYTHLTLPTIYSV